MINRTTSYTPVLLILCFLNLAACHLNQVKNPRPNILWILLEDTSPLLGCYGMSEVATPHIDQLAADGMLFRNAFMPSPVCSACRSSIITGMMSTSLGLHNHHSSRTEESAIHLPDSIKTIPELFKEDGYFTFNNGKDDYNFDYDRFDLYDQDYSVHPLYGKRGSSLDFSELIDQQPFFGQVQLAGGKEIFSSSFEENVTAPVDRNELKLPPYLPDHPVIVEEYANHLDAIQITDRKVGEIMAHLRENNLLDNTIVFFFSDHGMRHLRHKQFLYDGGIHVPLIISDFRASGQLGAGSSNGELISGIDLGTTALGMAGISIPSHMEGRDVFDEAGASREYVISTRDRCDFTIDRIRSVRSKEYKYIRNFMRDRPYTQLTYMDVDNVPFVKTMKQLYIENQLDSIQSRFMSNTRPAEELYALQDDPFELVNLAHHSAYESICLDHASILDQWIVDTNDKGQYPEDKEGLKLMLGIWGEHAVNPEYAGLREEDENLAGSLWSLKGESWKIVTREASH